MRLGFYGAAGGVTGSHTVIDLEGFRIGVDAGLFQGSEMDQNKAGFGHDPRSLNALLLTHAHVDHSGRIPQLVKEGFSGPVLSTSATLDLCEVMLKDSAHLMQEASDHASDHERRHRDWKHNRSTPPLYTEKDVVRALGQFKPLDYGKEKSVGELSVKFKDAGHILGSAIVELCLGKKKLVFSGDLGRPGSPFLRDPEKVDEADWLVLESTYGDKDHGNIADRAEKLLAIILETLEGGGNIIIPSFAIGRTQEILYELNFYAETGKLKGVKCFVDSPMAVSATEIYGRHPECFDEETLGLLRSGDDPLEFPGIQYTRSRDESKAINDLREPHIVISAGGMCTGGRVLHHLIQNIERNNCTLLFVGYQAEGTLGRRLLDGAGSIKIMDKQLDVRARIESLDAFSAHAGRGEILKWLRAFKKFPGQIFLNHGELNATHALAEAIRSEFDSVVIIPKAGQRFTLE
ncbi:MAG: MBL fold metallo-hydrolase [Methanothrix sp.]|jgi:metallo-beta-lactamase family protein|nr:MBL fold metallo-hydrolase [Methanothrix sp.]